MSSSLYDDVLSWMDIRAAWGSSQKKDDCTARQVNTACEEHSTIIDNLRSEIEQMKAREKYLIREFSKKQRKLEDPSTAAALEIICQTPYDEDMPLDEYVNDVRFEQRTRQNNEIQSRRFLDEIRTKMEAVLKEKIKEVLLLEKKVESLENDKQTLTQQLQTQGSGNLLPTVSFLTVDSVIGTEFIDDTGSVTHSLDEGRYSLNQSSSLRYSCNQTPPRYKYPPPEISLVNMTKAIDGLAHGEKDADYSYLSMEEKELLEMFRVISLDIIQRKTIHFQETMKKLMVASTEKDSRIDELQAQILKLESHVRKQEEELKSIPEKQILLNQLAEAADKYSILENSLQTFESDKETLIQDQRKMQVENDEKIRAIQRVLADFALTKDKEITELKEKLKRIGHEHDPMEPL